ncbi:DUF488 family protein, N3 subclade [Hungatella hathewayi]|uniref:DUF488 family protein, N3 subclade n=1 Tax=Hungatella hathewayi TaxID=154046 RepID=UPI0035618F18
MIYTSYYAKIKNLPDNIVPISIAGKAPTGYDGLEYKTLAPKIEFFMEWKKNKDNDYYIKHFKEEITDSLNSHKIVSELYKMTKGKDIALICYEKTGFCHRHLVAKWLRDAGYFAEEWNLESKVNERIISVTGHRPNKLFGYDMNNNNYTLMKNYFKKILIEKECTKAVSGMALGVDQVYAEAAVELKKEGYDIKLIAAIPCQNHPCKWPNQAQEHYHDLLKNADKITLVSDISYNPYLMQVRNEYMVNISNEIIAVWDGTKGGTGNCVKYAESINRPITVVNQTFYS